MSVTTNRLNNTSSSMAVHNLLIDGNTISSTDTDGNVVFAPDGTGVVSVTAAPVVPSTDRADSLGSTTNSWDNVYADGISFDDGTNVLSVYETGTWTPTLDFGGASTGITYGTQTGYYAVIGKIIIYWCELVLTSKGSSTGRANLSGMPFTPFAANEGMRGFTSTSNITFIGSGSVLVRPRLSDTICDFPTNQTGGLASTLQNTEFADDSSLNFTLINFVP